jgi:FKBP-type peptidyl-prolyl cis-trans isomerase FkpA
MLRNLIVLLCITVVVGACIKRRAENTCPYTTININAPLSQVDSVRAYLDSNNIEATLHPSGFYYKITEPGTGPDSVNLCTQVLINYKGQLTNGSVFDQQNNVIFVLGSLIEGWKKGIPLLKKGGVIRLFIPPALGYGNQDVENAQGQIVIPANSVLVFDVTLIDYMN